MRKISSLILALLLILQVAMVGNAEIPANTANVNGVVVGGWLRLRSGPSYSSETIASLPVNSVVRILTTEGDWCKVQTAEGTGGYMSRFFLNITSSSPNTPSSPANPGTGATAQVYSYNGGNVRLRSGPSFSYGVIGTYPVGTSLTIITHGKSWDYIKIGSQQGYMKNEFIRSAGYVPAPSTTYTAYVTSRNGLGVRLRAQPKAGSTILGLYSVGTQVTVLQHNVRAGWDYIQIGNRTGYMDNKFLTTTNPSPPPAVQNTVTDFILTTTTPRPGETVRVVQPVPNNASVGYRWKLGANILSTSNSLVVPNDANGKTIVVEVYGTNNYRGTVSKNLYVSTNPVVTKYLNDVTLNKTSANVGDNINITALNPSDATATYAWQLDNVIISYNNSLVVPNEAAGKTITLKATGSGEYTGTVTKTIEIAGAIPPAPPVVTYSLSFQTNAAYPGTPLIPTIDWTPGDAEGVSVHNVTYEWTIDGTFKTDQPGYIVTADDVGKTAKCVAKFQDAQGNNKQVEKTIVILAPTP